MIEIERKFSVKKLPNLSGIIPISYERYYLKIEPALEERIQKKGDTFEHGIKQTLSDLSRTTTKTEITEHEFEFLKKQTLKSVLRESYCILENPKLSIKIYHGDHEGLIRAEVEFSSEKEAKNFVPYGWMGEDITNNPLGRDSRLLQLSSAEFKELLRSMN